MNLRFLLLLTLLLGPTSQGDSVAWADNRVNREAFDTKTDEPTDETARWYPLKVGNGWTYKVGDTKFTVKVTKFEKIGDQTCARVEMSIGDKIQYVEHIAVKDGGVYS